MGTIRQWFSRGFARLNAPNNGAKAEALACNYLKSQGLKLVKMNYSTKVGEIDLIMQGETHLIFIEVRHRSESDWSTAAQSITSTKQQKVIKAAKQYLQQHKLYDQVDCRFDAVVIEGELTLANLQWIQHAFY